MEFFQGFRDLPRQHAGEVCRRLSDLDHGPAKVPQTMEGLEGEAQVGLHDANLAGIRVVEPLARPEGEISERNLYRQLADAPEAMERVDGYRSEERRVGKECRSRWAQYH